MKLIYLANNRIPSEKANSLQIMQMCAAFSQAGVDLQLIVPRRRQPRLMRSVADPFAYYGLDRTFSIVRIPCLDALEVAPTALQHPAFAIQSASFSLGVGAYLTTHSADLYYSRDPLSTILLALAPARIRARSVYEAHTFPRAGFRRSLHIWAIRRIGRVVCITRGLAEEYRRSGVREERILVAPDAVDLGRFRVLPQKVDARMALGMPPEATVVCYAGHLYPWKGVYTLAEASELMPPDHLVYLVGGTDEDLRALRGFVEERRLSRVRLVGHVKPDMVPTYLAAADVLALPNSAYDPRSSHYTSPMKMFEYMAARRPIVASRLPALMEVLRDGENGLLVEPDDPAALAAGIARATSSPELALRLVETAWRDVQHFTWKARASSILGFVGG